MKAFIKMIWIVNGTRLKTDRKNFELMSWDDPNYYEKLDMDRWLDNPFPHKWRQRLVTVYFDTGDPKYLICLPKQGFAPSYYYVPRTLFTHNFRDMINQFGDGFFVNRPKEYFINLMETNFQEAMSEAKKNGVSYGTVAYKVRTSHHHDLEKMGLCKDQISAYRKISSIQQILQQAKHEK